MTYPDQKEVSYTYGKAGERRSITYPDGRTVYYGYDEQLRLSELKEGDRIITYGYDAYGRLSEKQFPNGTGSTYHYDRKDQLTELVHRDKEGILDRYTYLYDLLGNKTGITRERRGLTGESGSYTYGYDALDRLESIRKDNVLETQYRYDAFGNRTKKESGEHQTSYQYNALNQLINQTDQSQEGTRRETYLYDRRGNLSQVIRDGTVKNRYVYGALNRLEEAVNATGQTAKYQYNGLGHRVGKQEGKPESNGQEPMKRISYLIDLTKEYHNLLEKTEDTNVQTYLWDGNVALYEENGRRNYYLQDDLGSTIRIEGEDGILQETYGYGAFGEDLYGTQERIQPFGYTGYQRDSIAGTYYAQAREYNAGAGRFVGQDVIAGVVEQPLSLNRYVYVQNQPMNYIDVNGMNREDARKYMEKYAADENKDGKPDKTNSEYPLFSSGNCANFVSQCLVAGGVEMNEEWKMKDIGNNFLLNFYLKNSVRIASVLGGNLGYSNGYLYTKNWSLANEQYKYFSNPSNGYINGKVISVKDPNKIPAVANDTKNQIQTGDLAFWLCIKSYGHC